MLLFLVLAASALGGLMLRWSGEGHFFAVASASMEPTLAKGTLVHVDEANPSVGDIVVYWSPVGTHQIHRVIEIREGPDGPLYRTKGDANPAADAYLVPAQDVRGVMDAAIPFVGGLWLLPDLVHRATLGVAFVGYVVATMWEARAGLRPGHVATVIALTAILLIPITNAATTALYPTSSHTLDQAGEGPVPLSGGTAGISTFADFNNSAGVNVTPTSVGVWKEIVLWSCDAAVPGAAGCVHEAPLTWTDLLAASHTLGSYAPSPLYYFQAMIAAPEGGSVEVKLYDRTGSADVAGSNLSTNDSNLTVLRTGSLPLTAGSDYALRTQASGPGGQLIAAKILVRAENPTTLETVVPLAGGDKPAGDLEELHDRTMRWKYVPMDGEGEISMDVWVSASDKGLRVQIWDADTNTRVVELKDPQGSYSKTSKSLTGLLTSDHTYEVRHKSSLADAEVHSVRIVIAQTNPLNTTRYVHLGYSGASNQTVYADIMAPATVHADEAPGTLDLEALMHGTGSVVRIRWSAGPAVGGDVQTSSATMVRVSTAAGNPPGNHTYRLQGEVDGGTMGVSSAWFTGSQDLVNNEIFDYVLQATSTVCNWTFHLDYQQGVALSRLAELTIWYDGNAAAQIQILDGAVTSTMGPPFEPSGGLRHVMRAAVNGPGTSSIDVHQLAQCGGTTAKQAITYRVL